MNRRSEKKSECILILHNIRSAHNVGALFRTADGAGVSGIVISGYTPCPPKEGALYRTDVDRALQKTALGAENFVPWKRATSPSRLMDQLRKGGYELVALEQGAGSVDYRKYRPKKPVALIVGNEVRGIDGKILKRCDAILEIPMRGQKNSLNVSVAAGIALYRIMGTIEKAS